MQVFMCVVYVEAGLCYFRLWLVLALTVGNGSVIVQLLVG